MAIDDAKLKAFLGRVVMDIGSAMSAALVIIGDQLGIYRAMADGSPVTSDELAARTGLSERYLREWLNNQAAGGYVAYESETRRYHLEPEQAVALADETSPAFIPGAFQVCAAAMRATPRIADNFRTGRGMDWGEHDAALFEGTERFFRPNYAGNLIASWIPAIEGMVDRLTRGAKAADVGCGFGASTILMARAFPNSEFLGFDAHRPSVEAARQRAAAAGLGDRVRFQVARSTDYPGRDYDFVAHFDCLHDMGDPVGAARHVHQTLRDDGVWMVVEPFAHDHEGENHTPVGRVYYGASTMICVPASLAHDGPALGTQAGPTRLNDVIRQGGFSRIRRAAETPFNIVYEARK